MNIKIKTLLAVILFLVSFISSTSSFSQKQNIQNNWKKFYDEVGMEGAFAIYNQKNKEYTLYNPAFFREEFLPASTFKIFNSLVGIETGIIADENFIIKWDGMDKGYPLWNKDQDLREAFKNSTVWYYQELARRVGGKDLKIWLDRAKYGNTDTSGGIDMFWLTGGLRISMEQQIDFLKRLQADQLPFSKRSMDIVKNIMIREITPEYTIRSKTGWIGNTGANTGWYVGYVELKNNIYFFANYLKDSDASDPNFAKARIEITNKILKSLKIIK